MSTNTPDIEFVDEQQEALKRIFEWAHSNCTPQVFKLFGPAGTGKTTLAKVLGTSKLRVLYCAPTGKAAFRLRQLGCPGARTLHSVLYVPTEHRDRNNNPVFRDRPTEELLEADVVAVDESSMVDTQLGTDLLDSAKKVLILGDPYQLPPVNGPQLFSGEPDFMLTQVHRQAAGNPIIQAATHVRNQAAGGIPQGSNEIGRFNIIPGFKEAGAQDYVDQILVGKNTTRVRVNQAVRARRGILGPHPEKGEKLVCVRNNPTHGLYNGSTWTVLDIGAPSASGKFTVELENTDDPTDIVKISSHHHVLTEKVVPTDFPLEDHWGLFHYGYALTVHKAQGSQWPKVLLYNEAAIFRDASWRWMYTGITRAQVEMYLI